MRSNDKKGADHKREPSALAPAMSLAKRTDSGSYARLAEVLSEAEVEHLITGKACDELADAEWARIVRFVRNKRLDQLSPQLQRLVLDCLLSGAQRREDEMDALWTATLTVEPDNKVSLAMESRLLDSILTPAATSISRRLHILTVRNDSGSIGRRKQSGSPGGVSFVVPRSIATRSNRYILADGPGGPEQIGSGQHSIILSARREGDGATVAIKLIHPGAHQLSFFREYLTYCRFAGEEGVMQVYEAGKYTVPSGDGESTFMFMVREYGNMTLAQLIEERQSYTEGERALRAPFLTEEKRFFSSALLSILKTIHGRRIIHCDIKPENIFLGIKDGFVVWMKIGDFGIARHIPDGVDTIVLGRFEGTPAFSPRTSFEKGEYNFYTDLFGYARTVACLEPGLLMTGIGQTTQRQIKKILSTTTRTKGLHTTTSRSAAMLGTAKRHMAKTLSSALFMLVDSDDPFVLFVILPILAPERYPYCPRTHAELAPLAAAAHSVQDAIDLIAAGKTAIALAELKKLETQYGSMPWYPIMASDLSGLARRCEDQIRPSS